jgi:hypothetical protein
MAGHVSLAAGRWHGMSLAEQLANVGSEVSRARKWAGKDAGLSEKAFDRALELIDLTLSDPRWKGRRLDEIARARELLCDAMLGGRNYGTTLDAMDRYFLPFCILARNKS